MNAITTGLVLVLIPFVCGQPHYVVDNKCPDKPADIVFVLDGSGSEGHTNFQKELTFVRDFTKSFNIGPTRAQVSVVQFATTVRNEFKLNANHNGHDLQNALNRVHWLNGETYTGDALNYVDRNSFEKANGGRNHVDRIVIVVTDGESNHPNETIEAAKKLHSKRITVVAVGVGNQVNVDELNAIASNSKHVFTVPNFDALKTIHKDITDTTCKLCDSTPVDLAFLLDGSGSEGNTDFNNQKNFAKLVAQELNYNGGGTHVGVVTFSTTAHTNFEMGQFKDEYRVVQAINRVSYPNGESYTHTGLQLLTDHTFNKARYGSKHVAIVLTDGRSNEEDLTRQQAARLKAKNVLVIAVGIGSLVDQSELNSIATSPQYVLNVNSSHYLSAIHDKVIDLLCESKMVYTTTTPKPTTTTTPKPTTKGTTTPKPRIDCGPKPADILFLIDNSDSEGADNFQKAKTFVRNFANRFVIDATHNQVSVVSFSTDPKNEFWLNQYHTRHDVTHAIDNIKYIGTGTDMAKALDFARTESFSAQHGARKTATKIAIVITDGRSNDEHATQRAANHLKRNGVTVISIGVGFQDTHELEVIASNKNYVFSVQNFDSLKTIQKQVIDTTCQDHTKHHHG